MGRCAVAFLLLFSAEKRSGVWVSRLLTRFPSLCYSSKWKQSCKACFLKKNYGSKKGSSSEHQSREKSSNHGGDLAIFNCTNSKSLLSDESNLIFQVLQPKNPIFPFSNNIVLIFVIFFIFFIIIRCKLININVIQTSTLDTIFIFFQEYFKNLNIKFASGSILLRLIQWHFFILTKTILSKMRSSNTNNLNF